MADKLIDPSTGVELRPSFHGKDCPGSGDLPGSECCCDECDYFLICYPDWKPGAVWNEDQERYI